MRKTKKILSILLSCMMLLSLLSVGVFAAEGDQDNPINANDKWFGYGVDCFLMNTTLEANDADGVWYELTADAAGILQLENSYSDVEYQVTAWVNGVEYAAYENGVYNRPIITYPVAVGDVITIQVVAQDTTLGGIVYMNAKIIDGSNDIEQMVKVKSAPAKLHVGAGQTIFFQDDSLNADYATKYVNLAGDSVENVTLYTAAANAAGVVSKQRAYRDTDGDGVIETRLGGAEGSAGTPAVKPAWAIQNASDEDRCFVLTVVEEAHECVYDNDDDMDCNTCGANRGGASECNHDYLNSCDKHCMYCGEETRPEAAHAIAYVAPSQPTCTAFGNLEHWACAACGMAWLDEACTQNTNAMEVRLPMIDHTYAHDFDVDCDVCGSVRQVEISMTYAGESVSQDVNGLAVSFNVQVPGMKLVGKYTADYTNATLGGMKLVTMGALVSNNYSETNVLPTLEMVDNQNVLNITAAYLLSLDEETGAATYAVRVLDIPDANKSTSILYLPYVVVEDANGQQYTDDSNPAPAREEPTISGEDSVGSGAA